MVAFIHRDLTSFGNSLEHWKRNSGTGVEGRATYCKFLVDICKREDPSRPTTAGFNKWTEAIENGLAKLVDVQGWNYKPQFYKYIHRKFSDWSMLGSETASTVS